MSVVPAILLAVDADGIATLTLNRPDQLNAFDLEMVDAWRAALEQAEADERVKVIVVTGAGRAFCAGGDFEEMAKFSEMDSMGRKDFLYRHVHRIALTLERMEKPVIAAVNGAARGAGCDMALMCDIRLMASSATLAESYINIGLMAGDAGAWYLPRLIGTARALELFWTGRVVGAEEADRMTATYDMARTIAAKPQQAVRFFRRAVYQSQTMALATHLDMVSSHMAVLEDTPEHRAGIAAFRTRSRASK